MVATDKQLVDTLRSPSIPAHARKCARDAIYAHEPPASDYVPVPVLELRTHVGIHAIIRFARDTEQRDRNQRRALWSIGRLSVAQYAEVVDGPVRIPLAVDGEDRLAHG